MQSFVQTSLMYLKNVMFYSHGNYMLLVKFIHGNLSFLQLNFIFNTILKSYFMKIGHCFDHGLSRKKITAILGISIERG